MNTIRRSLLDDHYQIIYQRTLVEHHTDWLIIPRPMLEYLAASSINSIVRTPYNCRKATKMTQSDCSLLSQKTIIIKPVLKAGLSSLNLAPTLEGPD